MITRSIRHATIVLLAVACAVQADPPTTPAASVAAEAIAAGKRTVTVVALAIVTYPADQFAVAIKARSGLVTPDAAQEQLDVIVGKAQDALRTAGLPLPTTDANAAPGVETGGGKLSLSRALIVTATSAEQARAVRNALAPLTDASNSIDSTAKLASVRLEFSNAKRTADEPAAKAAVRQQALANARVEAEQNAAALHMKLGAPISTSVIAVDDIGSSATDPSGLIARGEVVFEMTD